jgi:YVTN family beta-propeller protein
MPPVRRIAAAFALSSLALAVPAAAAGPAYVKAGSISGPDAFWDYANWDPASQQVLVGHSNDILVVDPAKNTVRAIGNVVHAHIALAIPGTDEILVTSGGDNSVRILDRASGKELAKIAVGEDPDAAVMAPDGAHAYVMDARSGEVSVIDLKTDKETGRIMFKPGLEAGALVTPTELAVNNEDESEIELANLATDKPDGTIAITGCTGPSGLAYAADRGLSISTCRNGKAALVNLKARKLVKLVDIGEGPDTAIYDAARKRFIVPCGRSGTLSLVDFAKPGSEPMVTSAPTELGARTGALAPATGRLFLPTAKFQPPAQKGQRPTLEPGSFHILVMKLAG